MHGSVVYFTIAGIVAFALPLLLQKDSTLSFIRYSVVDSGIQAIYQIGIAEMTEIYFAPLLNIIAINMLQMTLSFFVKEVYAFICCLSFLILSVYMPSALILGNGAMIIRSELYGVGVSAISSYATVIVSLIMVVLSVIIGIGFLRGDLTGTEGLTEMVGDHIIAATHSPRVSDVIVFELQKLGICHPAVALVAGDQLAAIGFLRVLHIVDDFCNGRTHGSPFANV